jgi:type II secretory pathway pseudopilin PulG
MAALVAMALVGTVLAVVGWQMVANRRRENRRQETVQAAWLAKAGVELAIDKLLADPEKYRGETTTLNPQAKVSVKVEPVPGKPDRFTVTSVGTFPVDRPQPASQSLTRQLRRKTEPGGARIEVVP